MSTSWQTVSVFISSTFNDMHAERDYLVKRVFPELREWCEKRKLRLVDIDLRWGVTEEDATKHRNVVKVCLDRIDECRPFFLCFLGQRRGWVPGKADVSKETCDTFKDLKGFLGNASVTELEILHATINPLNDMERAQYSFFYLRDDSYLKDIPANPPLLRKTYTNEGIWDRDERDIADKELTTWRVEKIPLIGRPFHHYSAIWDENATTPELRIPLRCPSSNPVYQNQWRSFLRNEAGILITDNDIEVSSDLVSKALEFNGKLSGGRLGKFTSGDKQLSEIIINDLKKAIEERYPENKEIPEESDLQKEVDQQDQFLHLNSEGFIERSGDFDQLDTYADGDSRNLFVLTAPGGMGKTMLLANWIDHYREKIEGRDVALFYRFIGASDRSNTIDSVIRYLLREMKENAGLIDEEIPADPDELRKTWSKILERAAARTRIVIVIDAINQIRSGLSDVTWFPWECPVRIKIIVSFKRDAELAEELCERLVASGHSIHEVHPFSSYEDRQKLIHDYLAQYLKNLDKNQIEEIITAPGSENPLFLKIMLSELRVFGTFVNLTDKIKKKEFGDNPASAFNAVFRRLENDPVYSPVDPKTAVPLIFGLLSHARYGLSEDELAGLFLQTLNGGDIMENTEPYRDTIRLFLRQVRPFLAMREGRHDFFYEGCRIAAKDRYEGSESVNQKRSLPEWHKILADYFDGLPVWISYDTKVPTLRRIEELPYHLQMAQQWERLSRLLSDLVGYLEYTWIHDYDNDIVSYWESLQGKYDPAVCYKDAILNLENNGITSQDLVPHLRRIGDLLERMGFFKNSRQFRRRSAEINRELHGAEDPETVSDVRWIGLSYYMEGNFENALIYLKKTLEILKRKGNLETTEIADLLSDIGLVYWEQGRYTEAKEFCTQSLSMREKILGPEHKHVALSLNNLAAIYHVQHQYDEALPLYSRSLKIREKILDPNHTDIGQVLNNIGSLYSYQGKFTDAFPYLQRALRIHEHAYGSFHPYLATICSNMAGYYQGRGNYPEAEKSLLRALEIDKKTVKPDHPIHITHNLNLGCIYADTNRFEEALQYQKFALKKAEEIYEPDHQEIVAILLELAATYLSTNDIGHAEPLLVRAKTIGDRTLTWPHKQLGQIAKRYGRLMEKKGEIQTALSWYQKAEVIARENYNDDELTSILIYQTYVYYRLGQPETSMEKVKEAYDIAKRRGYSLYIKNCMELIENLRCH